MTEWSEMTEAQREKARERSRRNYQRRYDGDPEFREKKIARTRAYVAEKRTDPEYRREWNERQKLRAREKVGAMSEAERVAFHKHQYEVYQARLASMSEAELTSHQEMRREQQRRRNARKRELTLPPPVPAEAQEPGSCLPSATTDA